MIQTGLLSITFRKLHAEQIVRLAAQAELDVMEWGGDVHVPHGDVAVAKSVGEMTRAAGLQVASYGSYFAVGEPHGDVTFEHVLDSALALQAPTIRIWAGRRGSQDADASYRTALVEETQRIAAQAAQAGLTLDFEYHRNTLTDTLASTMELLAEVNQPNVRSNWQPPVSMPFEERMQGLQTLDKQLAHLHVFQWNVTERRPLEEGAADWVRYLRAVRQIGGAHAAMLEFVRDDDPEQFLRDAATLRQLVQQSADGADARP